jgi:hypothetical protein
MEASKILTWAALVVAGLVCLIFILDAAVGVVGQNIVLDIMFIFGGGFVLWQGVETLRELR